MRVDTAISLIKSLVYKPGWIFEPTDNTKRFESSICLKVTYPATNSDREEAAAGFPTPIPPRGAYASFVIMTEGMDDVRLYGAIAEILMAIEEHEMREFLRTAPTYWSPFHPHNTDGIRRWAEVTGRDYKAVLQSDTSFGLA